MKKDKQNSNFNTQGNNIFHDADKLSKDQKERLQLLTHIALKIKKGKICSDDKENKKRHIIVADFGIEYVSRKDGKTYKCNFPYKFDDLSVIDAKIFKDTEKVGKFRQNLASTPSKWRDKYVPISDAHTELILAYHFLQNVTRTEFLNAISGKIDINDISEIKTFDFLEGGVAEMCKNCNGFMGGHLQQNQDNTKLNEEISNKIKEFTGLEPENVEVLYGCSQLYTEEQKGRTVNKNPKHQFLFKNDSQVDVSNLRENAQNTPFKKIKINQNIDTEKQYQKLYGILYKANKIKPVRSGGRTKGTNETNNLQSQNESDKRSRSRSDKKKIEQDYNNERNEVKKQLHFC